MTDKTNSNKVSQRDWKNSGVRISHRGGIIGLKLGLKKNWKQLSISLSHSHLCLYWYFSFIFSMAQPLPHGEGHGEWELLVHISHGSYTLSVIAPTPKNSFWAFSTEYSDWFRLGGGRWGREGRKVTEQDQTSQEWTPLWRRSVRPSLCYFLMYPLWSRKVSCGD